MSTNTDDELIAWGAYNAVNRTDLSLAQYRAQMQAGGISPPVLTGLDTKDGYLVPDATITVDETAGAPTTTVKATGRWER